MQTLKTKSLVGYHLVKPASAELSRLSRDLRLNPLVTEELSRPTMRPKTESYDGQIYLVLHLPVFNAQEKKTHSREVDFVLTGSALVTVANDRIAPLDDFFKKCSSEQACEDLYASKTPAHLFAAVVRELYSFALRELDHIHEHIDRIEERVFATEREEEQLIEDLSFVRRDIIEFRRSLKPQQGTLESLVGHGVDLYGPGVRHVLESLIGEYAKVWNLLENHKEAVDALYENNVTVLNIKQNEAMRILSIMAFVTFPLVLFAQIFSMGTISTPILGRENDFWIIVAIMIGGASLMFMIFKGKKWL